MTKIYWTFTSLWAFVVYAIIVENMNNFPHFPAMQKVSNAVCKRISHLTSLQIISSSDQRGCTLFFLICSSNFSSCTVYTVYVQHILYVFTVRVRVRTGHEKIIEKELLHDIPSVQSSMVLHTITKLNCARYQENVNLNLGHQQIIQIQTNKALGSSY